MRFLTKKQMAEAKHSLNVVNSVQRRNGTNKPERLLRWGCGSLCYQINTDSPDKLSALEADRMMRLKKHKGFEISQRVTWISRGAAQYGTIVDIVFRDQNRQLKTDSYLLKMDWNGEVVPVSIEANNLRIYGVDIKTLGRMEKNAVCHPPLTKKRLPTGIRHDKRGTRTKRN